MGNAYSTVPYNAQINQINAELACRFYAPPAVISGPYQTGNTNFTFSSTSPLVGGAGQEIYYSDLAGDFIFPIFTTNDLYDYSTVAVNITVTLDAINAAPSTVILKGSVINSANETNFRFNFTPVSYILGEAGQDHSLELAEVVVDFTFDSADGTPGLKGEQQCLKNEPPYIISTTNVDDSSGSALNPSNSGSSVFPPTAFGSKYSLANIPLSCNDGRGNNETYNLTLAATMPLTLNSGDIFNFTDVVAFLTIPSDVVYALSDAYGPDHFGVIGLTSVFLDLDLDNATPSQSQVTGYVFDPDVPESPGNPTPITYRYLVSGTKFDLPMPLPRNGSINIGPYTAGASGSVLSVDVSSFFAIVSGFTYLDGIYLDGMSNAKCVAVEKTRLFSIPVA